jgi:hypothetical protein
MGAVCRMTHPPRQETTGVSTDCFVRRRVCMQADTKVSACL